MSLYLDDRWHLIHQLNRLIPLTLNAKRVYFSPLRPTGYDMTLVRLTALATSVTRGSEVLLYERLDLADLMGQLPVYPRMVYRSTLYELLPFIRESLCIHFTPDDVEDAPVSEEPNRCTVTIKAKETSYRWVGETTLVFLDLPPISIPLIDLNVRW